MAQRKGKKTNTGKKDPAKNAPQQPQATPPSLADTLKDRLKGANKTGLLGMLNEVQKTTPDQWKNPENVKNMAKKLAETMKIPVSEERLNQFMKAFGDATKGGKPNANVDELVNKYGKGKVDEKTLNEMKKFIKPKD